MKRSSDAAPTVDEAARSIRAEGQPAMLFSDSDWAKATRNWRTTCPAESLETSHLYRTHRGCVDQPVLFDNQRSGEVGIIAACFAAGAISMQCTDQGRQ